MSLFSHALSPFERVVHAVDALVPSALAQKYGQYAHVMVANIVHDAETVAKAGVAEAKQLSAALIASVTATIESEAETLAKQVLSGQLSFSDAVAVATKNLKSEAVLAIIPGLKVVGQETLTTMLRVAGSTAIATLAANPISPPASSSAGSSAAPSKP
jgi:hypothetical protein